MELLVILAIALTIFLVVVYISQEQTSEVMKHKEETDARNSVEDLGAAAREVYAQGEGAKKQVYINIPSSYDPASSSVEDRAIKMNVRGSDYAAVTDFDVHGSLPLTSGAHWIWVISEGNKVRIGSAMLSLDKSLIYIIMDRNDSAGDSFTVTSIWDKDITVTLTENWPHTEVSMGYGPGTFSLSPEDSQPISLSFTASENAIGFYYGWIDITGDDGNITETVKIPVNIEVLSYVIETAPPLNVTPNFWAETMQPGNSTSKNFTVCTNEHTSVTSVSFTPSSGEPGTWVGNTAPLGPIGAGSCEQKMLTLSVPNSTATGTYAGSIQVLGGGVSGAQDTITLYVVVQESGDENETTTPYNETWCHCPIYVYYYEEPVCNCQPATVYVKDGIVVGGVDDGKPYNGTLRDSSGDDIIVGTEGDDIIITGSQQDVVCGMGGDDTIYGGGQMDFINGGPGNDIIYGGGQIDTLVGGDGDDIIYGGDQRDDIDGGPGNDILYGDGQEDLIYGGPGNDEIHGGAQADVICGNAGNDVIYGDGGSDDIDGGTGINTIDCGGGDGYRGSTYIDCSIKGGYMSICGST